MAPPSFLGTLRFGGLGMICIGAAVACNSLTGLNDVTFTDDDDGAGGSSTATTGTFANTSSGMQQPMAAVDGVSIGEISLYQGIRRPLMENGMAASSQVPVVAGRAALMRVFYAADPAAFNGEPVTARLTIDEGEPIEKEFTPVGMSTEGALASTLNFEIPGELLLAGSRFRVELLQAANLASGDNQAAIYPAEGQATFEAESAGSTIKVVLVPIQYNADGSGRLPDTSPEQVQLYRDGFYGIYPAPAADVTVIEPLPWPNTISPFGQGWGEMLQAFRDFRASNNAAPDEYYYGIFNPAQTFGQYCGSGCILGLSGLGGPMDPGARASIGIGFSGEGSVETGLHEVGHAHGREHAPCNVNNQTDPGFPHNGGVIGDWGYNLNSGMLIQPSTADFMSYCDPTWISDYTFNALFTRIQIVNGADLAVPADMPSHYERISIGLDGVAQWKEPMRVQFPPSAEEVNITLKGPAGQQQVKGQLFRYSHLSGGYILFPPGTLGQANVASFVVDGQPHEVVR